MTVGMEAVGGKINATRTAHAIRVRVGACNEKGSAEHNPTAALQ